MSDYELCHPSVHPGTTLWVRVNNIPYGKNYTHCLSSQPKVGITDVSLGIPLDLERGGRYRLYMISPYKLVHRGWLLAALITMRKIRGLELVDKQLGWIDMEDGCDKGLTYLQLPTIFYLVDTTPLCEDLCHLVRGYLGGEVAPPPERESDLDGYQDSKECRTRVPLGYMIKLPCVLCAIHSHLNDMENHFLRSIVKDQTWSQHYWLYYEGAGSTLKGVKDAEQEASHLFRCWAYPTTLVPLVNHDRVALHTAEVPFQPLVFFPVKSYVSLVSWNRQGACEEDRGHYYYGLNLVESHKILTLYVNEAFLLVQHRMETFGLQQQGFTYLVPPSNSMIKVLVRVLRIFKKGQTSDHFLGEDGGVTEAEVAEYRTWLLRHVDVPHMEANPGYAKKATQSDGHVCKFEGYKGHKEGENSSTSTDQVYIHPSQHNPDYVYLVVATMPRIFIGSVGPGTPDVRLTEGMGFRNVLDLQRSAYKWALRSNLMTLLGNFDHGFDANPLHRSTPKVNMLCVAAGQTFDLMKGDRSMYDYDSLRKASTYMGHYSAGLTTFKTTDSLHNALRDSHACGLTSPTGCTFCKHVETDPRHDHHGGKGIHSWEVAGHAEMYYKGHMFRAECLRDQDGALYPRFFMCGESGYSEPFTVPVIMVDVHHGTTHSTSTFTPLTLIRVCGMCNYLLRQQMCRETYPGNHFVRYYDYFGDQVPYDYQGRLTPQHWLLDMQNRAVIRRYANCHNITRRKTLTTRIEEVATKAYNAYDRLEAQFNAASA